VAVSRALAALCARTAAVVTGGAEARDVASDASPAQLRNISVCSQLHEVHRALLAQVPRLPAAAAEVLCDALEHVQVRPAATALRTRMHAHPTRAVLRARRGLHGSTRKAAGA
jgi:hypothetical protein